MTTLNISIDNLVAKYKECCPEYLTGDNFQMVIGGLAKKAYVSFTAAISLIKINNHSEALILLRSAYEAILIQHTFLHKPEMIVEYQNFSRLINYRNTLSALSHLDTPDAVTLLMSSKEELLKHNLFNESNFFNNRYNENLKKTLIEDNNFSVHLDILGKCLKNNIYNAFVLRDSLYAFDSSYYNDLNTIFPWAYNIASQAVHSQWQTIIDFHLGIDGSGRKMEPFPHPLLICHSLVIVFRYAIDSFDKCGLTTNLSKDVHPELSALFSVFEEAFKHDLH